MEDETLSDDPAYRAGVLMRGDKADELGRLKGEYDALNTVAQQKQCRFRTAEAPAT